MKRHILSILCIASIACASAAYDRGSKPSKEDPDDGEATENGECDEYDLLCIEKNSLWPTDVSVEEILSESWESKRNVLDNSSRIRIVGRHVKNREVESAFRRISSLPSLRHLIVQPNTLNEGEKFFVRMRSISWLLSKSARLETLLIHDLDLYNDKDVDRLAASLSNCISLQSIELRRVNIGKNIKSLEEIFDSMIQLDNLREVTVELSSIVGGKEYLRGHVNEGIAILQDEGSSLGEAGVAEHGEYLVLSNVAEKLEPVLVNAKEVENDAGGPGGEVKQEEL